MRVFFTLLIALFLVQPLHADIHFLSISDFHYGHENTPGDGHDTNDELLASALNKFKSLINQVDFILNLGDQPTHMLINSPKKEAFIAAVFHGLFKADYADKPMFYITGNNDSLHGDYQPFSWEGKSPLSLANDWQGACAHCDGLMIDSVHMLDKGYYSSYVRSDNKDIILIELNSVQFSRHPFYMPQYTHQNEDALQQLQWLDTQLKNHHAKQLLIAMHVPPGRDYQGQLMWKEQYLKQFITLLSLTHHHYGEVSLLTAHTHMDDIRKIRLDDGKTIYTYATPSISRIHHNNPAMKIFDLNTAMKLKNYTTYYTTNDNSWGNEQYRAINGPNSIFPQCLGKFLAKCLDGLTETSICKRLKDGAFYGAKSPRVNGSVCKLTIPISLK